MGMYKLVLDDLAAVATKTAIPPTKKLDFSITFSAFSEEKAKKIAEEAVRDQYVGRWHVECLNEN